MRKQAMISRTLSSVKSKVDGENTNNGRNSRNALKTLSLQASKVNSKRSYQPDEISPHVEMT
jgi:hypothetical protein